MGEPEVTLTPHKGSIGKAMQAEKPPPAPPEKPVATGSSEEEEKPDPIAYVMSKIEDMEKRLRNQDTAIARKEAENKRLQRDLESRDDERDLNRTLVSFLAAEKGQTEDQFEGDIKSRAPDVIAKFDTLVEQQKRRREEEGFRERVADYQRRTEDAGLTEKDDDYWIIQDAVFKGQFPRADAKLDQLIEKASQKKPVDTEAQEKLRRKEIEEEARRMLEESGQLKTETGSPSGLVSGKFTMAQIDAMSAQEFRKNFPNGTSDVAQGVQEGTISV